MGVHFSGYTNSTKFTDCCETAICDDERYCPECKQEIHGTARSRHNEAMMKLFGRDGMAKIRARTAKRFG